MDPKKQEFKRLLDLSGWTQAEAARKLELTRGGVNGLVTGKSVPSQATLKLFRLILESERPEALHETAPEYRVTKNRAVELLNQIRGLQDELEKEISSNRGAAAMEKIASQIAADIAEKRDKPAASK